MVSGVATHSSSPWVVRRATPVVFQPPRLPQVAPPSLKATIEPEPPDWIQDIRRKYTLRVADWLSQAWALTVSPRRFMEAWASGQRETLNPLRFFAVGTALTYFVDRGGRRVLHLPSLPNSGVMGMMTTHLGVTVMVLLYGVVMHAVLRLRSRAPLRSTLAAIVFASAGPGAFLAVLGWVVSGAIFFLRGSVPLHEVVQGGAPLHESQAIAYPWPVLIDSYLSFVWTIATLAAAHRCRWWWPVLAFLALIVVLGIAGAVVGAIYGLVA
jgi:hypothetical protein